MTCSDTGWPSTVVVRSRSPGSLVTCGAKPEFAERGHVVLEGDLPLGAGDQCAIDGFRQPLLRAPPGLSHRLKHLRDLAASFARACPAGVGPKGLDVRNCGLGGWARLAPWATSDQ